MNWEQFDMTKLLSSYFYHQTTEICLVKSVNIESIYTVYDVSIVWRLPVLIHKKAHRSVSMPENESIDYKLSDCVHVQVEIIKVFIWTFNNKQNNTEVLTSLRFLSRNYLQRCADEIMFEIELNDQMLATIKQAIIVIGCLRSRRTWMNLMYQ